MVLARSLQQMRRCLPSTVFQASGPVRNLMTPDQARRATNIATIESKNSADSSLYKSEKEGSSGYNQANAVCLGMNE